LYEAGGAADAVELWVLHERFAICSSNWRVGRVGKALLALVLLSPLVFVVASVAVLIVKAIVTGGAQ
jgi:hypothetical protein